MKSLYRRYRPLKLEDVIGQEQVTKPLIGALKDGRVSHAYLFVGPRGTGKTSVARIFAHAVNGFSYTLEDDYVDIIEIDAASNRGIDNIRDLREKVAIAPTSGKYKVYIIDEVHMLTKEAFNALLKTLEEPPKHVIFIMATTDAYKVPVTITSRAQTYNFKLAEHKVMFDYLKNVCKKEKIIIDDDALDIIVKRGGGSFRDTLSLLDQISTLSDKNITKTMVISAMGLPEDEKITGLLDAYNKGDTETVLSIIKELLSSGIKVETLTEELITAIIDNPKPELISLLDKLTDVKAPFAEARLLVALVGEHHFLTTDSAPGNVIRRAAEGTALRANPSGSSGIYISKSPNLEMLSKNDAPPTPQTDRESSDRTSSSDDFSWQEFLEKVGKVSKAIYTQLSAAEYSVDGNDLNIYPAKNFDKTFLSRDKNKQILAEMTDGKKINILDKKSYLNSKKDELISKMSDIMGGEVISDGGGDPFE